MKVIALSVLIASQVLAAPDLPTRKAIAEAIADGNANQELPGLWYMADEPMSNVMYRAQQKMKPLPLMRLSRALWWNPEALENRAYPITHRVAEQQGGAAIEARSIFSENMQSPPAESWLPFNDLRAGYNRSYPYEPGAGRYDLLLARWNADGIEYEAASCSPGFRLAVKFAPQAGNGDGPSTLEWAKTHLRFHDPDSVRIHAWNSGTVTYGYIGQSAGISNVPRELAFEKAHTVGLPGNTKWYDDILFLRCGNYLYMEFDPRRPHFNETGFADPGTLLEGSRFIALPPMNEKTSISDFLCDGPSSPFIIAKLRALKASPATYDFVLTGTGMMEQDRYAAMVEFSIPGDIELDSDGQLKKAVVNAFIRGNETEFTVTFDTKGWRFKRIAGKHPAYNHRTLIGLTGLMFADFIPKEVAREVGWREGLVAGDWVAMVPAMPMMAFGPLRFVKAGEKTFEFEATKNWAGKVPLLPQWVRQQYYDFAHGPFPHLHGPVVLAKDSLLIESADLRCESGLDPETGVATRHFRCELKRRSE